MLFGVPWLTKADKGRMQRIWFISGVVTIVLLVTFCVFAPSVLDAIVAFFKTLFTIAVLTVVAFVIAFLAAKDFGAQRIAASFIFAGLVFIFLCGSFMFYGDGPEPVHPKLSRSTHVTDESVAIDGYSPRFHQPVGDGVRCVVDGDVKIVTLTLDTMTWALNGGARALAEKNAWIDGKTVLDPPRLRQLLDQGLALCGTDRVEPMVLARQSDSVSIAKPVKLTEAKRTGTSVTAKVLAERPMTADSLIMAANDGDLDFVRHWIATGKSVNVRNKWESTPVSVAAASGNCDLLDVLLAHGGIADPKSITVGFTPLYFAAHKGNAQCVASLIKKKVRLNVRNVRGGDTALIAASYMGNYEAAKLLVDAGASLTVVNGDGDTPYRAAMAFGNYTISSYIQSKGGH